jgi:ribosomal protein L12E/L44/L45/RPP1/RPP2
MKKKIKIDDSDYKELLELMSVGIMLQETGKAITKKAENILSTLATYGVEVPEKRIERITKENRKSIKWVNFD